MSRFGQLHGELAAVLVILVLLGGAEATLRRSGANLSADVAHLLEVEEITARVASGRGTRVLLWGNSLIGAGVDADELGDILGEMLDSPVAIGMVRPDGSGPLEWRYLLRKSLLNRDLRVDLLVLGVGPGHLSDRGPRQSLDRLAAHHVAWTDIPRLFDSDVVDLEDQASFLVSRFSAARSLRDRIRDRVLARLVPGYREVAPTLLAPLAPPEEGATLKTYSQFRRLLDETSSAGIPVAAIIMPAPAPWTLEPQVASELARVGAVVLDVRGQVMLPPERFPDAEHLDAVGRQIFTAALAPQVARAIQGLR